MKIKSIEAKNFKSLAETQADSFSDNNIIFGYNNSGKSNLMQLIYLVFKKKADQEVFKVEKDDGLTETVIRQEREAKDFWEGKIIEEPFLFFEGNRSDNIEFKIEIEVTVTDIPGNEKLEEYTNNGADRVDIVINGEIVSDEYDVSHIELKKVQLGGKSIYTIDGAGVSKYFETSTGDLKDDASTFDILLAYFNNCVQFIDSNRHFAMDNYQSEDGLTPGNFKSWLYNLYINPESYNEFVDLMSWLDKFTINTEGKPYLANNLANYPLNDADIGFSNPKGRIDVMLDNDKGRYPLASFGTGIQQILYILARVYANDAKILIVEELELNLSPTFQNEFLNFLQELIDEDKISQLFFTSHSNYLVDHDRVKAFYVVEIDEDGKSHVKTLTHGGARDYFNNQFIPKEQ